MPIDTDADWELFGRHEPYHGVLTHTQYLRQNLDAAARDEFFASGAGDVRALLDVVESRVKPGFKPTSVLDFGCGVGRNLVAFAAQAERVVGVDVSKSMLAEARKNCDRLGLTNVELVESDDELSRVGGTFALVHTLIVLQHIPVERGETIIAALIDRIEPGGIGVLHMTYEALDGPDGPPPPRPELPPGALPPMQMNRYDLNRVFGLIQNAGVHQVTSLFTDHGGHRGVSLYFECPRAG